MKSLFHVDHRFGWRDLAVIAVWVVAFVFFLPYGFQQAPWGSLTLRLVSAVVIALILASASAVFAIIIFFA